MANKKVATLPSFDANKPLTLDPLPWLTQGIFSLGENPATNYLRKTVYSKYCDPSPASASNRAKAAISKWLLTEERNRETNLRIEHTCWAFHILPGVPLSKFLRFTDSLIGAVLRDVDREVLFGGFSGGATTSRSRDSSHPAEKYRGRADITDSATAAWTVITGCPGWFVNSPCDLREVVGNVMFTVPKNSDIDRCACKEPDGNMYMQKGVGNYIRRRLRTFGIDLNDQSRNRELARLGSIDGSLATLDLSAASDSVTTSFCRLFLPRQWYELLMELRSPVTFIPERYLSEPSGTGVGLMHTNEMMSSMGNGFTFEVESLLFWLMAKAVCYFGGHQGNVSVYGDDIIVPTGAYHDLVSVLSHFGFIVNRDKSFWDGPFRESCGGHYWNGRDITPFYVKGPVRSTIDLIHLGNQVRAWAQRAGYSHDLYEVWLLLRDCVPQRLWGGRDLADKTSLVTGDAPRHKLVEVTRKCDRHVGDYIYWLDSNRSTGLTSGKGCWRSHGDLLSWLESEKPVSAPRKVGIGRFRTKPNKIGPFSQAPIPWVQELLTAEMP